MVADLDGDGSNELIAAYYSVYVFGRDRELLADSNDGDDGRVYAPHVVVDLEGDGTTEIVVGRGHEVVAYSWSGISSALDRRWVADTTTAGNAPEVRAQGPSAVAAVRLYFEDRDDGSVVVIDAGNGVVLDTLEPGSNGFLRGAMRTFVSARRASDIGAEMPFVLEEMPNGQLLLRDPATGRLIDLRAFGPTNAEAFGRFLKLAAEPVVSVADPYSGDMQLDTTAVALSNQEVNP